MNRDIRIPAGALTTMRRALARELGPEAAARGLQDAGHAAGDLLFERLGRNGGEDPLAATPSASFWHRLSSLLRELGWGSLSHEDVHPGVGALVATDWFELDPGVSGGAAPFTTGVLANVLGRLAGQEVAVLQVPDPDGLSGTTRFLFGAADLLDEVYAALRDGQDLETSLAALG